MKHNQKHIALLLTVLVIVISCKKEDDFKTEEQTFEEPVIKTVTFENAGPVFNKLKQDLNLAPYLKSKDHMFEMATESSRTTTDTLGFTIYTDVIKEVTLGDYTSYTMLMATSQTSDNKFYNLTVEEKNGESNMFTAEYTPDEQWLNNQIQSFSGNIKIMHLPPESSGGGYGGNPVLGPGVGGVGNSYSEEYPWDCQGTVIASTQTITHLCECVTPGHLPGQCTDCDTPGYYEHITVYTCEENWDSTDPGGGNPNAGGGGSSSTDPNNPQNNDNSVAAIVSPNEDCNMSDEDRAFDEDNDCQLSPKEACKKAGYKDIICNCVDEENSIEECIEKRSCNELKLSSNDPEFIEIMMNLNTKSTTVNKEVGYIQRVDTAATSGYAYNYFEEDDVNVDGEMNITIPPAATLKGFFHTHDDEEKHSPVFSIDDLYAVFNFFNPYFYNGTCFFSNTYHLEEDFTMILITTHGTKLALKFDSNGIEKLRQFGEKYFSDWHINLSALVNTDAYNETDRAILKRKFYRIVKKRFDAEKQKQRLARFLENQDFGMSLYESNNDFTQWKKINKDGTKTPCN